MHILIHLFHNLLSLYVGSDKESTTRDNKSAILKFMNGVINFGCC